MDIYLVQHGQALSEEQDSQRPLSSEGRAQTIKLIEYLADKSTQLITADISEVRHSGKLRAQQTAEILAHALGPEVMLTTGENMSPKDDPCRIYNELTAARDRIGAIILVGHLPHLARLTGLLLTGSANRTPVRFVNSGVLKISPTQTDWVVDWYLTPACVP